MHAREELGRVGEFQVDLLSPKGDIDLDDILGQNVTVKLTTAEDQTRVLQRVRHAVRADAASSGGTTATLAVVRPVALVPDAARPTAASSRTMTVPEILKAGVRRSRHRRVRARADAARTSQWTYCVQYRETDFNFVSRLMEHEGIYYYVRHTDGHNTLVLVDSTQRALALPDGRDGAVRRARAARAAGRRAHQPVGASAGDPARACTCTTTTTWSGRASSSRPTRSLPRGYSPSDYEVYDYPGCYVQKADGDALRGGAARRTRHAVRDRGRPRPTAGRSPSATSSRSRGSRGPTRTAST